MLPLHISGQEFWDEANERFLYGNDTTLKLEHSLISISRWESKWMIPFYDSEKTGEMVKDYIKCMTLNTNVDPDVYDRISMKNIEEINEYIGSPMTASSVKDDKKRSGTNEKITSELIYYWMTVFNIPFDCEKWHINRLIMLIRICSEKSKPAKKMSAREIMAQNKALNAARKARLHSKG